MEQLELVDIYREFHPGTSEYTCFSTAHGTFSKIDHLLVRKTCLSICKKTNYSMYIMWPRCNEIGNKWQKKPPKPHKYMEIRQYPPQKPMGYRWYQTRN